MGPGLVSADTIARVALWWISRGAQYVPVSYLPWAYLHYVNMVMCVAPVAPGDVLRAHRRGSARPRGGSNSDNFE